MTITMWRPTSLMDPFRFNVRDLFDEFFSTERASIQKFDDMEFCPLADSYVKDNVLHVSVELPGVDPHDVDVSLKDGCLQISGERKKTKSEEEADYRMEEMSYGKFVRSFSLPDGMDADQIHASFENGILTVAVQLPQSMAEKKIPIKGVKEEKSELGSMEEKRSEEPTHA